MSMQTDVKSAYLAATGTAVASTRTRVRSVIIASTAVAGSVILRDGGASGTSLLQIDTPAAAQMMNILLPGEGILFSRDVHGTLTNCTATVVYG
jgi:hypothetical protein